MVYVGVCIDNVITVIYSIYIMSSQDTIQIRVDKETKEAARKTLNDLGIDMSSAIKLFLYNVVATQSIPLDLKTANGFTMAQEATMLQEAEAAKKEKGFNSLDDVFADLEL